ncbi:MAG: peptide ABC transporter ATP-binding protein [Deltaproteobacteria bacterium RIFCSPHIGHO2_12_FULL_43_9]|nr:MAG: peptide ABC transporter ATP-binding protein [Deltaproteobacteria bacterium RIFCSPHIGHO2_12_FULL_43_9]
MEPVLRVENLRTAFQIERGLLEAVAGVNFRLHKGKTLGLVGESGCGKSVTSLSIMRLIPSPPGVILDGKIWYEGKDLLKLSEPEMRKIRGNKISMIFQEPMTSLNPVFTVGNQIMEAIKLHQQLPRREIKNKAIEMLKLVKISAPERRINEYPHQLSGGMRQRVMIAMALSCDPDILIADEPSTALDVTIQAQILELLSELQAKLGMSILLITHDLGVVAETANEVAVMYAGKIVEYASVDEIFHHPMHPYTVGLLKSVPKYGEEKQHERLETIPGIVPDLLSLPLGCRFQDRCPLVNGLSREAEPELEEKRPNHWVACFNV